MEKYSFLKLKKHHAITRNGKVVKAYIPIPQSCNGEVIFFNEARQSIGNRTLAMQTELSLDATSDEIKDAVKKYEALRYRAISIVRYARLTPLKI